MTPTDLPAQLGRYRIKQRLGGGGMGAVYLVENIDLQREEALKVPHFASGDDPLVHERFLREARAAAKLDHPNLCPIYEVGVIDGVYFLTMRHLPGKPLSAYTSRPHPPRDAVKIVAKLAQALAHAHEKGVIHRDLKPGNIMMCPGTGPTVLDFGLAKQTKQPDQKLTQTGTAMGTPAYMPPEQVRGELERMGPASDVYSLGVILFELLTGRLPFDGSAAEVMGKVLFTEAPLPSRMQPGLSAEVDAVCGKAMAKEPENRYPSMRAFASELASLMQPLSERTEAAEAPDALRKSDELVDRPTLKPAEPRATRAPARSPRTMPSRPAADDSVADEPIVRTTRGKPRTRDAKTHLARTPARGPWFIGLLALGMVLAVVLVGGVVLLMTNRDERGTDRSRTTSARKAAAARPRPNPQSGKDNGGKAATEEGKASSRPITRPEDEEPTKKPAEKETPAAPPDKPPPPTSPKEAIDRAIEKGVAALRRMQQADGTWKYRTIGATALGGLTLVACNVDRDDKAVTAAAARVREAALRLTDTYSLSLAVLFLDRLDNPDDTPLIESMIVRLLAGQMNGYWSYNCPTISEAEVRRLQAETGGVGGVLKGRRDLKKLPARGMRKPNELPKEIQAQLAVIARNRGRFAGPGCNSTTQFATMALWIGRRYGMPTQTALLAVERHFRGNQEPTGGWGYGSGTQNAATVKTVTPAMTCAGLLGLAVGHGATLDIKRRKNPKLDSTDVSTDAHLKRGLQMLSDAVGKPTGWNGTGKPPPEVTVARDKAFYYLWSLERVAVVYNLETIGKKDWYRWGGEILLNSQKSDGSWTGEFAECGADTCFALLFLKRFNFARDLSSSLSRGGELGR